MDEVSALCTMGVDMNWPRFLLLATLASCTDPIPPALDQLDVTVTLSNVDIALGEETELRAVAANRTSRDITFVTNACVVVFEVLDAGGRRFVEPIVCSDVEVQHTLRPGESLQHNVLFDGTGWLTVGGDSGPGPGDYTVRAGVSLALRSPSEPVAFHVRAVAP